MDLIDRTPKHLRCGTGSCPGVYELKNVTPNELVCSNGPCPGVYEDGDDLIIIGKHLQKELMQYFEKKVGADEHVIRISKAFFGVVFPRKGAGGGEGTG